MIAPASWTVKIRSSLMARNVLGKHDVHTPWLPGWLLAARSDPVVLCRALTRRPWQEPSARVRTVRVEVHDYQPGGKPWCVYPTHRRAMGNA